MIYRARVRRGGRKRPVPKGATYGTFFFPFPLVSLFRRQVANYKQASLPTWVSTSSSTSVLSVPPLRSVSAAAAPTCVS